VSVSKDGHAALLSVVLNEVKDLIAACHRWGNRHEILRCAQDDKREA